MLDDIPQLRTQLDAARRDLQVAQERVAYLEAQLASAQPAALSTDWVHHTYRAFDHLLESCMIIGFDWRCLYINEIGLRYSRLTREQMVGRSLLESFPGFEQTEAYPYLRRGLVEREANDYELEFPYPNGPSTWYAFRVQPVPEGVFVLSQDITERKNNEAHLRKLYRTLSVLSDTNQSIVRLRHDLPTLFQTVCSIAVNQGGFLTAWIGEIAPDRTHFIPVAWAGINPLTLSSFTLEISDEEPIRSRPSVEAARTGQRIVVSDVMTHLGHTPERLEQILDLGIRSMLMYPLRLGNAVHAVFALTSAEPGFFDDADELRLLDEMAGDIEYAMEFAEQEAKREQAELSLRRSVERLAVLHAIDRALLNADSLPAIVNSTLGEMRRLIPCERAGVVLFDKATNEAVLYMLDTATQSALHSGQRTPMPSADWIASFSPTGVKAVGDLRTIPAPYGFYAHAVKEGMVSMLHVLLIAQGEPLGLLNLLASTADFFTPEYAEIAAEVGGQIAIAIRQMRLDQAIKRHTQRLEVLHAIDQALLRADSLKTVLDSTVQELRKLIPCQRAGILLFDAAAQEVTMYSVDIAGDSVLSEGYRAPLMPPAWFADFDERGLKGVGDFLTLAPLPPFYQVAVKEGMRSILHVLLTTRGQRSGLLNLLANEPDFFTPEYQEIALEVGGQLAIAIQQMQMAQAITQHTTELETKVEERTRQLRAENERIQAILHYSLEGIAFLDADFRLVETNAAFRRLVNYAAYATEPTSLFDVMHVDDQQRFSQTVNRAVAEGGGRRFEIRLIKAEHVVVNVEIGLQNITDDGFVCSFHDISDRQRAEQALRLALEAEKQANILKSRFVSMASHEFRTPLAAILASTETLTLYRDRMNDDDIGGRLANIRRQVNHMAGIMENVLQLGRMQSGRLDFQPVLANVNTLCAEIVEEFNNRPVTNNRVVLAAPDSIVMLSMDVSLIRQSITNLIGNALKYSESPLPVHLHLSSDNIAVTLHIRDQGIGIPAKDLPYLFEPFHRASNVGGISGTGLGLSITKQAIELHGGSITVDSQEGRGTTFTITLPVTTLNLT